MAIFTLAAVAIAVSQSSASILAWWAIQGLGSAILAPSGFAADAELNASVSAVELQEARLPDRVQVHSDVEAPLRS
jgi:hypothetical protein